MIMAGIMMMVMVPTRRRRLEEAGEHHQEYCQEFCKKSQLMMATILRNQQEASGRRSVWLFLFCCSAKLLGRPSDDDRSLNANYLLACFGGGSQPAAQLVTCDLLFYFHVHLFALYKIHIHIYIYFLTEGRAGSWLCGRGGSTLAQEWLLLLS